MGLSWAVAIRMVGGVKEGVREVFVVCVVMGVGGERGTNHSSRVVWIVWVSLSLSRVGVTLGMVGGVRGVNQL
jgi:hypothetical protein